MSPLRFFKVNLGLPLYRRCFVDGLLLPQLGLFHRVAEVYRLIAGLAQRHERVEFGLLVLRLGFLQRDLGVPDFAFEFSLID